jgi:hypothetical protein
MPQIAVDTQKLKRSQRRAWGCLALFLMPFVLCAACYGGMWAFARYGGEWVDQVAIPPESQSLIASEQEGYYVHKTTLYVHVWTPEELREWFVQHDVGLTPIWMSGDENNKHFLDPEDYYINIWTARNWSHLTLLHYFSAVLTSSWSDDANPMCREVKVYKSKAAALKDYPKADLPDGISAFQVKYCWPNVLRYP